MLSGVSVSLTRVSCFPCVDKDKSLPLSLNERRSRSCIMAPHLTMYVLEVKVKFYTRFTLAGETIFFREF